MSKVLRNEKKKLNNGITPPQSAVRSPQSAACSPQSAVRSPQAKITLNCPHKTQYK